MTKVEITTGEALDRLSILSIKCDMIEDPEKHEAVEGQFRELYQTMTMSEDIDRFYARLRVVNGKLWNLENKVRSYTSNMSSIESLRTYREITALNDMRASIKRETDEATGEKGGEVKQHG